ncbi:hypothetical protein KY290_024225 [Solanum tuberosum]|uniref:Retrotransposon Copia-like N-terminal domain-containing protein n=1 Tax=Solanum tuberosum TaxID=4113 RepID=A0ABQ7UT89_SOLTU|nr:hypothetical protein KY290_024225 [Solanum tuberosum]
MSKTDIDHLYPSDTTGVSIISLRLTWSESYSLWSHAMRIQLLGKNKLGLVDVANELLTRILYAKDARAVWEDLRERFDKVNASRVYQLYKGISTIMQGSNNISTYFSKLRDLWIKFDSMVPNSCDCPRSKNFIAHMESQKLMQFLMGLSESYDQARSQILMTSPTPSINKTYSMLIERESQRTMANTSMVGQGTEVVALLDGKKDGYQKPPKN